MTLQEAKELVEHELFLAYDESLVLVDGEAQETVTSAKYRQAMDAVSGL